MVEAEAEAEVEGRWILAARSKSLGIAVAKVVEQE